MLESLNELNVVILLVVPKDIVYGCFAIKLESAVDFVIYPNPVTYS
jgi:hypothetical protein